MAYGGIKEPLTWQSAREIISCMYNSSWDTEDEKIKDKIAKTVNHFLRGNTAINPLYRKATLSAIAQAISNIPVILEGLEGAVYDCRQVTEETLILFYTTEM